MKVLHKVFSVFIIATFLCMPLPRLYAGPGMGLSDIEPRISLDFKDASLKDVLKIFSMQSNLNFIASEAMQDRRLTLYLDQVPLDQAMDLIFRANNLSYEFDKQANVFIVKDWGAMRAETVTKVFYLKHASVTTSSLKEEMGKEMQSTADFQVGTTSSSSATAGTGGKWNVEKNAGITEIVKTLLSKTGSVVEDYRTNSLVVTDSPQIIETVTQVIAALDVPVPQILLEVEMLDVSKNVADRIGFDYGTTPLSLSIFGNGTTDAPTDGIAKIINAGKASLMGLSSINSTAYNVALDFLRSQVDTKYLARPRIMTLNNEPAEIRIATNEAIGLTATTSGSASLSTATSTAERAQTGVILKVTPQVNLETGEITMFLYPKVAEAVAGNLFTAAGVDYQFRDPEERSLKAVVRIKDGDTVVIGGLIRNENYNQMTKMPFLGDLPIIGGLFRHRGATGDTNSTPDKNKQRELIVFITPHIIPDAATNAQVCRTKKGITLAGREQGTASGASRQAQVDALLNSYESR